MSALEKCWTHIEACESASSLVGHFRWYLLLVISSWLFILLTEVRWGKSWFVLIPVNAMCERSAYWSFYSHMQIFLLKQQNKNFGTTFSKCLNYTAHFCWVESYYLLMNTVLIWPGVSLLEALINMVGFWD